MDNKSYILPARLGLLLKRHLSLNLKSWSIGLLSVSGFLLMFMLLHTFFISQSGFSVEIFTSIGFVIIFIGGYIFTSKIFDELHKPLKNQFYLTLPASHFEKLISSWLLSGLFFVSIVFLTLTLLSIILSAFTSWILFFEIQLSVFNPLNVSNLQVASYYLVTQSVFLLGALYFKKNNFLKTVLAFFLISIFLQVWWVVIFGISGDEFFTPMRGGVMVYTGENRFNLFPVTQIANFNIFWYLTLPFLLLVSYFRLKERTV